MNDLDLSDYQIGLGFLSPIFEGLSTTRYVL